jgi:glycosyltransferase involved in cell wall biosynthesis
MTLQKISFYVNLFFAYTFEYSNKKNFLEPSKSIKKISNLSSLNKLKIYFYAPLNARGKNSAGTDVVILGMLSELQKKIKLLSLPWDVYFSNNYPEKKVDYLILFKSLPPKNSIGNPKVILSICDEGENFWNHLNKYHAIVVSSSRPFYNLIKKNNPNTFFISEAESEENLSFGLENLKKIPSSKLYNLYWHGGPNSLSGLLPLKPHLIELGKKYSINLHIVSGHQPKHQYKWGSITVIHRPWSINNMRVTARNCALGIIPSRGTLRTSFLKPASRVRALYALGVPTIGDSQVPDVVEFASHFGGPLARTPKEFIEKIEMFFDNPKKLNEISLKGHETVSKKYHNKFSANQWINFFLEQEKIIKKF